MRLVMKAAILGAILGSSPIHAQSNAEDAIKRIVGTTPTTCSHNKECLCASFSPKANIPLRYTEAQYCPTVVDGHQKFNVTTWKGTTKVDEGQRDESGMIGQWTSWHENGAKASAGNFVAGRLEGRSVSWYPNGMKESEAFYENGVPSKTIQMWYDNGQLRVSGTYADGKPAGVWNIYEKDGHLKQWRKFDHGKLVAQGNGS